jgi:hypothetical protein
MQAHEYTHGSEVEAVGRYFVRVDATLYRQIIGSMMYLMNTKPNICFSMNILSQLLVEPRCVHLVVAKHVMRYLKGTIDYGLSYDGDHDFKLSGYIDADWA